METFAKTRRESDGTALTRYKELKAKARAAITEREHDVITLAVPFDHARKSAALQTETFVSPTQLELPGAVGSAPASSVR